eukprot:GHVT01045911.1.p1 GENE.GHVT01045911.1~~GHVT01045911.1.p1  ORF type:complete len:307 (-),score=31.88 GHVT01045911.1:500-1420(-)
MCSRLPLLVRFGAPPSELPLYTRPHNQLVRLGVLIRKSSMSRFVAVARVRAYLVPIFEVGGRGASAVAESIYTVTAPVVHPALEQLDRAAALVMPRAVAMARAVLEGLKSGWLLLTTESNPEFPRKGHHAELAESDGKPQQGPSFFLHALRRRVRFITHSYSSTVFFEAIDETFDAVQYFAASGFRQTQLLVERSKTIPGIGAAIRLLELFPRWMQACTKFWDGETTEVAIDRSRRQGAGASISKTVKILPNHEMKIVNARRIRAHKPARRTQSTSIVIDVEPNTSNTRRLQKRNIENQPNIAHHL